MANNNNNNQNEVNCVEYRLPDMTLFLPTWNYIMSELTPFIEQLTTSINAQNTSLTGIESRIDYWLSEQSQQGG
jgi:hypothetical protein